MGLADRAVGMDQRGSLGGSMGEAGTGVGTDDSPAEVGSLL